MTSFHESSFRISDRIYSTSLDNGIHIHILPNHRSAGVSVQAWVRTGSIHEGEFLGCGLSHFLEHMVFTGTKSFPGSTEIMTRVNNLGGNLNAETSHAYTMYYINVPSASFHEAASMITEMVTVPLFPEECFQREKKVILNECNLMDDNASAVLLQHFLNTACLRHPIRIPTQGFWEKIQTVDRDMMTAYFKRRYTPGRIFFVVAGDIDPEEAADFIASQT